MIQLTPAWTLLRPHEAQIRAWRCSKRFLGLPCGRGSGKTDISRRRLVRYLPVKKPWSDPMYAYCAPTRQQAKRIAWDQLLSLIPKSWLKGEPNVSDMIIRTVFGSSLHVVGMDKPQRIEGSQWDGIVIDESSDIKPGAFDRSVSPALVHRNAWCWRIGVPKRFGVGAVEYRAFCEQAAAGELSDATSIRWPSTDIVPREALIEAQQRMDPKDYDEQYNANWQSAGGQIFYAFEVEYNVRPCAYDPTLPIIVGCDFNVDPMAWVLGHLRDGRVVEWFDEVWERNTNTLASLNRLAARYQHHKGGWEFYGDATASQRRTSASKSDYAQIMEHAEFRRMGRTIHYPKANPPHKDRFAACNARFLNAAGQRNMFVDPRCKNLKRDLEMRHYAPGTTEPEDSGDLGHITDAMGYYLHRRFPVRVPIDVKVGAPVGTHEAR